MTSDAMAHDTVSWHYFISTCWLIK